MMILFNDGWQFAKGEPRDFRPVRLPHDWLVSDPDGWYESGIGWYRRELDIGFPLDGRQVVLRFDGVYMDSTLFVNGAVAGEWKYGYTAFEHDITGFLTEGVIQELLLRVDCKAPSGRWYTGAGIYRDVFLKIRNACHFVSDGIRITTGKRDGCWFFEVDAEAETGGRPFELRHTLVEGEAEILEWDPEHPRLYTVRSELLVDGIVEDSEDTRIGFRTAAFCPDRGFLLNGRHVKLNGVCLHHDLGSLGSAVHADAIRRQLLIFREMGVNALRTAHNPPAKVFMDLADEMGFLVMSELLDVWENPKNTYDYARFFDEWIDRDAASWIRRDRNRPSVILWSVGNEIADTHTNPERGAHILRRLVALVRKHDPKGHAPATFCSNYLPWENTQKCADIVKIVGYNYAESLYASQHEAHPDWVIYGGETCSTVQSRGIYHFPLSASILADDDLQCSALGNSATSWGAKSVEECIYADRDTPFSAGQFVWAGQDYLGEPTPYHTKNSYFGHVDTAGFPKDSYYLFKSAWTDCQKAPMVHIFPYWDFSEGEPVDVRVCSNASAVELFLDGESLGSATLGRRVVADWRIPYRRGVLRAIARDENGNTVAETSRKSFGEAETLRQETGVFGELAFVTITARDADGNPVENANRRVKVSVEDGTLLALDNGDPTDCERYQGESRRLFGGKLLAILRPDAGKQPCIRASFDETDIPVRKIELTRDGNRIAARALPENATHGGFMWRLADAAGIDSPLGSLAVSEDGKSALLVPRGDGRAFIRCAVKNSREHPSLISQLAFEISGMGRSFLDPYGFVSGGLYSASNTVLSNGNERGVATARDRESHVGFGGLDFGDYGSDEITLSLFPLEKDPFVFELWEGMPSGGGTFICQASWDKGSVWNTYQDATYSLPRRLSGVTSLCFVFRRKVHIKGFTFTRIAKAFRKIAASDHDRIYGDSFEVKNGTVEHIGNNVSIVFDNMDFGTEGAGCVSVCWRSGCEKNPVRIVFSDAVDKTVSMIDVCRSDGWTDADFLLERKFTGRGTVTFCFLPGSSLDLGWFRFGR